MARKRVRVATQTTKAEIGTSLPSHMSLASMPAEIIDMICVSVWQIHIIGNAQIYRNLSLTCRTLHRAVLPHLYKHIYIERGGLFPLARTLVDRPDLALAVEKIMVGAGASDLGKAYTFLHKPGLLPKACTRYLHPDDAAAINILMCEVLLLRLKSVKDLSINFDGFNKTHMLFDTKRWRPKSQALLEDMLPSMKDLMLYTTECEIRKPNFLAQSQFLLKYAKPQKLDVEIHHPFRNRPDNLKLESIQALGIVCRYIEHADLRALLAACPNVQSFEYLSLFHEDDDEDFDEDDISESSLGFTCLSLREVVGLLRPYEKTLKTLELSFLRNDYDDEISVRDTIGDLRQFSQLKTLLLSAECLLDTKGQPYGELSLDDPTTFLHKLPKSLETLWLFKATDSHLDELKSLNARKHSEFPDMKCLTLEWWYGSCDAELDALCDDLEEVDIEVILK